VTKGFTAETPRTRRRSFLFVPGPPEQTKSLQPLAGHFFPEGLGFIENRYLPILYKTIPLRVLCVSAVSQFLTFKNKEEK
jgi:hypothetical protein